MSSDRYTVRASVRQLVVDIHCHLGVPAADALVREQGGSPTFDATLSPETIEVNKRMFAAIGCKLNGVEERIADMDVLGIDVQAISPSPGLYYYGTPPELGREAARLVNDAVADAAARHPDRLVGMGTVPLQNVEFAIAEMHRCLGSLGLRGIEIGTNVSGIDLHDARFRPFFAAAEELGTLLFLHPLGFTSPARMGQFYFNNLIGNPLETTLALGHLIFGGVLDEYPGLRIVAAHGGGTLPSYWGRLDHGWHAREDCRTCRHPPSHYLRQLWFDTLVFDRRQLDALIAAHGDTRLCLGTDYPFDMAEPNPISFHSGIEGEARARIMGGNAAALLGLGGGS